MKGLTWLFGFLVSIPESNDAWAYVRFVYALIFCLLNSTQGIHIFIVYILVSKRRHEILKKKVFNQLSKIKLKFEQNQSPTEIRQKRKKILNCIKV